MGAQKVSPGLLPPPPRYPGVTCRKTKNLRFFRSQISDLRENVCISDNLLSHRGLVTRENLETVRFPLKNIESENWIQWSRYACQICCFHLSFCASQLRRFANPCKADIFESSKTGKKKGGNIWSWQLPESHVQKAAWWKHRARPLGNILEVKQDWKKEGWERCVQIAFQSMAIARVSFAECCMEALETVHPQGDGIIRISRISTHASTVFSWAEKSNVRALPVNPMIKTSIKSKTEKTCTDHAFGNWDQESPMNKNLQKDLQTPWSKQAITQKVSMISRGECDIIHRGSIAGSKCVPENTSWHHSLIGLKNSLFHVASGENRRMSKRCKTWTPAACLLHLQLLKWRLRYTVQASFHDKFSTPFHLEAV